MKEPWTVERFIELLKRHDAAKEHGQENVLRLTIYDGVHYIQGWFNVQGLVAELNERDRQ